MSPANRLEDPAYFEELYTVYYPMLCVIAFEYMRDRELAEDMVGEVFLNLWNHRASLRVDFSVKQYLVRATKNQCLQYFRKHRYTVERIGEEMGRWHIPWSDDHPLGELIEAELAEAITCGIAALPEQCARVFKLSRDEQLSYREIAFRLGISENTVKFHLKTALAKLREFLVNHLAMIL